MDGIKRVMAAFAWLLLAMTAQAVTYRTPELQRLTRIAGVAEGALHPGTNRCGGVVIRADDDMTVRHVGRLLFSEEVKDRGSRLVLEFVERYLLQLEYPAPNSSSALMMRSDGVTFSNGRWQDVGHIRTDTPFSLDYHLMRYTLTWHRKGTDVAISFPGKYQLICGENLPQAEEHLLEDIQKAPEATSAPKDTDGMDSASMPGFFIKKGAWYDSERLSASTYSRKDAGGDLVPVVDGHFVKESVANIMLCPEAGRFMLDITMLRYGYKSSHIMVPMRQWLGYCAQQECEVYCAIEKVGDSSVKATVLAVNSRLNFNHLLEVTLPVRAVEEGTGTATAVLTPFIPTHNIINAKGKPKNRMNVKRLVIQK